MKQLSRAHVLAACHRWPMQHFHTQLRHTPAPYVHKDDHSPALHRSSTDYYLAPFAWDIDRTFLLGTRQCVSCGYTYTTMMKRVEMDDI